MSRRRKNKASSSKRGFSFNLKPAAALFQNIDWRILQRSSIGVAWIALIAALIAGWTLSVPRLAAFASHQNAVDPHNVTVRFVNPPAWIKGALSDSLLRTATMQIGSDPLVRDDLVAVRQALLDTGWFNSVDQVRRTHADLVEIQARFVMPYTLIRDDAGYHLVDVNGKLLPKSYGVNEDLPVIFDSRANQTLPMIAINGVHFPRPTVGKTWEGADVTAGLKLLQLLDRQPWRQQIAEIDVSSFLRDGPIKLRTDKGSMIVWGGPPGEETALELLADGKIERLNLLYRNHGRIDGNRTGELDITSEKVAVAR